MKSEGQWNQVIRHKTVFYSRRSLVHLRTPWVPRHTICSACKISTLCTVIMNFIPLLLEVSNFYCSSAKITCLQNGVLRRKFGPKRDEVTMEWRQLHNEELNDLYSSPNIVRVIKSTRMRWVGHVARTRGEERCIQAFGGETWGKETNLCTEQQNTRGTINKQMKIFYQNLKLNHL